MKSVNKSMPQNIINYQFMIIFADIIEELIKLGVDNAELNKFLEEYKKQTKKEGN